MSSSAMHNEWVQQQQQQRSVSLEEERTSSIDSNSNSTLSVRPHHLGSASASSLPENTITATTTLARISFETNTTDDSISELEVKYPTSRSHSIPTILPSQLPRKVSSVSSLSSYSTGSSPPTGGGRRLSRKLPPNLTESLEMLALPNTSPSPSSSPRAPSFTATLPTIGAGGAGLEPKVYTLEVAPPLVQGSEAPAGTYIQAIKAPAPPPRRTSIPRKPVNKLSISGPTPPRASSAASITTLTSLPGTPTSATRPISPARVAVAPSPTSRFSVSSISTEADSLPPLTPKNSMPSMRAGPRHSLFTASPLHPSNTSPGFAQSAAAAGTITPSRVATPPPQTYPAIIRKDLPLPPSLAHSRSPSLRSLVSRSTTPFADPDLPALSCSSGSASESTCGTWSTFDVEYHPNGKRREGRKDRKARRAAEKARFDESTPPTTKELYEASLMDVIDEHGERVRFGDLVRGRKTIVVFIRHWFCSMCAQYIKSIIRDVSPDALEEAGVNLVIIGNGSAKMIDGYANKHFRSPFKTYTDPTLSLYRILGLTRQSGSGGLEEDKGDYLTETVREQTIATIRRAGKMPLRNPGHFTQLGGEFIFDGTLNVIYTHRMLTTRDHAPIRDICAEAGVRLEFIHYEPGPPPPTVHLRSRTNLLGTGGGLDDVKEEENDQAVVVIDAERRVSLVTSISAAGEDLEERDHLELDNWQAEKDRTLDRIKALRLERRTKVADGSKPSMVEGGGGEVRIVRDGEDFYEEFGQFPPSRYVY